MKENEISSVILIVEDSPEDFHVTERAFQKAKLKNTLMHCDNGDDAIDYVFQRGAYADPASAPRPNVILLDLNLPGTDGREVLRKIKSHPTYKKIPIIILTTSNDEKDIKACYELGANSYVQKPVNLSSFLEAIQRLHDYWLSVSILPSDEE